MSLRPPIRRQIDRLETGTMRLFALVQDVPEETLSRQPFEGYWSALQAVNHIYLVEKLSLQYIHKKLQAPEKLKPYTISTWPRVWMLIWALRSPLKFKAPPQARMEEGQELLALNALRPAWEDLRGSLLDTLSVHETGMRTKLVFRHPFTGRLTLGQMLIFLNEHLRHHTVQVRRILKAVQN